MKKIALPIVVLSMLLLSSCLVSSLHPFYTEKDIIYRPELNGNWYDQDSGIWVVEQYQEENGFMNPTTPADYYRITYYEKTEGKYKPSLFKAVLFSLENRQFVDFYPVEYELETDLAGYHVIPVHTLARFHLRNGNISFTWYNDEWLNELFEKNRLRLSHETVTISKDYQRQVLTAPTEELQKFLSKYADDERAFKKSENPGDQNEEYDYRFVLKRYDGKIPG